MFGEQEMESREARGMGVPAEARNYGGVEGNRYVGAMETVRMAIRRWMG